MCCEMIRAKKNRRVRADAADSNSPVCIRNVLPGVPTLLCSLPHSDQLKKTNDNWLQGLISLLFFASCDPAPRTSASSLSPAPHKLSSELSRNSFPLKQVACQSRSEAIVVASDWKRHRNGGVFERVRHSLVDLRQTSSPEERGKRF